MTTSISRQGSHRAYILIAQQQYVAGLPERNIALGALMTSMTTFGCVARVTFVAKPDQLTILNCNYLVQLGRNN